MHSSEEPQAPSKLLVVESACRDDKLEALSVAPTHAVRSTTHHCFGARDHCHLHCHEHYDRCVRSHQLDESTTHVKARVSLALECEQTSPPTQSARSISRQKATHSVYYVRVPPRAACTTSCNSTQVEVD